MNDESLSALMDGECSPSERDRLLTELDRDPSLSERFTRMCLARDVLQGTRVRRPDPTFAGRVRAALDPGPATAPTAVRRRTAWPLRPLVGLALAAGVAAAAVLVLRPRAPAPAGTEIAATPARPVAAVQPPAPAAVDEAGARQLRNYLIAYSQSRAQHGLGGSLGYARYAVYNGEATRETSR